MISILIHSVQSKKINKHEHENIIFIYIISGMRFSILLCSICLILRKGLLSYVVGTQCIINASKRWRNIAGKQLILISCTRYALCIRCEAIYYNSNKKRMQLIHKSGTIFLCIIPDFSNLFDVPVCFSTSLRALS